MSKNLATHESLLALGMTRGQTKARMYVTADRPIRSDWNSQGDLFTHIYMAIEKTVATHHSFLEAFCGNNDL